MPTWALDTREVTPHVRAEKMAVYLALFNQYWTWKLEVLKHLIVLNGLGLAAVATLSGSHRVTVKTPVIGAWIWWFVAGLIMAAFGMILGMQTLRKQRSEQIDALSQDDDQHPEMKVTKELEGMNKFIILSILAFGAGTAAIIYVFG